MQAEKEHDVAADTYKLNFFVAWVTRTMLISHVTALKTAVMLAILHGGVRRCPTYTLSGPFAVSLPPSIPGYIDVPRAPLTETGQWHSGKE